MGNITKFRLHQKTRQPLKGVIMLIALLTPFFHYDSVLALNANLGKGVTMDMDVTVKYSAAIRIEDQDNDLLANANADDGNRSFDKGDFINNRFSALMDIDINRDNIGFFIRPRAFYDFAYDGRNANDSLATHNNGPLYGGPLTRHDEFSDQTQDTHRDTAEILDAFAYGTFDLGGRDLVLRVGRQVVSWGESAFITNGISSAQSHMDATQANTPGMELKELFLPSGQIYSQLDLSPGFTLAGFYQWQWEKTILDESGAYFSTSDFLDDAGNRILPLILSPGLAPSIDRAADDPADDSGQWGIALRYLAQQLNDTEFGFYFINYHEKNPMVIWQATGGSAAVRWDTQPLPAGMGEKADMIDNSSYYLSYAENVKLYGFSFGTAVGETNIGGELSFRTDYPVAVNDPSNLLGFSYRDAEVLQAQVSFVHILGPGPKSLWERLTITGEVGWNRVFSLSDSELYHDRSAWGGVIKTTLDHFAVLPRLDLAVPLTFKFNPQGTSSVTGTFTENADSMSLGLEFTLAQVYQFGVNYTAFIGSSSDNHKTDRDFVGFNFKYTF